MEVVREREIIYLSRPCLGVFSRFSVTRLRL